MPKFTWKKNYTKAIALYNQLIPLNQTNIAIIKYYRNYILEKDYNAASEILHQLIKIAPFKSEELIKPIEQIIEKIPRHPVIRTLYANVLFRAFKPIDGCQEIATLVKYHPNKKEDAIKILRTQMMPFHKPLIFYTSFQLMIDCELIPKASHLSKKSLIYHQLIVITA